MSTATASWPLSYRFVGHNPGLAREFSGLLTSCGFVPLSGEFAPVTIVLRPRSDAAALQQLQGEPIVEWRGLRIGRQAERTFFSYRDWNLELDFTSLTVQCSGPDPDPRDRLNFREFFLLSVVLYIMHRLGHFELHAAAAAYRKRGYLFLGASGSGKTSAILSLIASGWDYLSDDAIAVSADPQSKIWARALRRSFSLKPDYLERDPKLAACATETVPGTSKRRLDPRQI